MAASSSEDEEFGVFISANDARAKIIDATRSVLSQLERQRHLASVFCVMKPLVSTMCEVDSIPQENIEERVRAFQKFMELATQCKVDLGLMLAQSSFFGVDAEIFSNLFLTLDSAVRQTKATIQWLREKPETITSFSQLTERVVKKWDDDKECFVYPVHLDYWLEKLDKFHRPFCTPSGFMALWASWVQELDKSDKDEIWAQPESFQDFLRSDTAGELAKRCESVAKQRVKYMSPAEQSEHKVQFDGGKMSIPIKQYTEDGHRVPDITLLDSTKYEEVAFVFKPNPADGKAEPWLIVGPHITSELHHTTYSGGDSIYAAGMMTVKAGVVTAIRNKTGHYKTNLRAFKRFVDYLQSKGCLAPDCDILVHDMPRYEDATEANPYAKGMFDQSRVSTGILDTISAVGYEEFIDIANQRLQRYATSEQEMDRLRAHCCQVEQSHLTRKYFGIWSSKTSSLRAESSSPASGGPSSSSSSSAACGSSSGSYSGSSGSPSSDDEMLRAVSLFDEVPDGYGLFQIPSCIGSP